MDGFYLTGIITEKYRADRREACIARRKEAIAATLPRRMGWGRRGWDSPWSNGPRKTTPRKRILDNVPTRAQVDTAIKT